MSEDTPIRWECIGHAPVRWGVLDGEAVVAEAVRQVEGRWLWRMYAADYVYTGLEPSCDLAMTEASKLLRREPWISRIPKRAMP